MAETEISASTRSALLHIVTDPRGLDEDQPRFRSLYATFGFLETFCRASFVIGGLEQAHGEPPEGLFARELADTERQRTGQELAPVDIWWRLAAVNEPRVVRLSMGSPLDVVSIVPPDWLLGGGIIGMMALAQRIFTFPIRLSERCAQHVEGIAESKANTAEHRLREAAAEQQLVQMTHQFTEYAYSPNQLRAISIYDQDEDDPLDDLDP